MDKVARWPSRMGRAVMPPRQKVRRRDARRCDAHPAGVSTYQVARRAVPREIKTVFPFDMRDQAILALLSEPTIGEAAARCGIAEKTLHRWLTDDAAFQAAFEAARQATFKAAISRIPALTVRAVDTLADLLADKEPPAVRLGAARTVADIGLHQYDAETIVRKLDEIEARQRR
jgi:hypothetical protein